jgi:SAM-dependent methyltransferase
MNVDESNVDQLGYWEGEAGAYWAARAEQIDEGVAAYHGQLLDAAGIEPGARVLDVGCGSGQTTRDAAHRAVGGHVLGVDLSSPMLELARRLSVDVPNVSFEHADAQVHPFPDASFDLVLSRNGVMFFGDFHAAFANLARALRPGGRIVLMAWAPLELHEGVRSIRATLAAGRDLPTPTAGTAGAFALSDQDWTRDLLTATGFTDIRIEARAADLHYGRDVDDALEHIMGQYTSLLADLDEERKTAAVAALRADLADHQTPDGVRYRSAAWFITATRVDPGGPRSSVG